MIGITKFLWDANFSGDRYRYHAHSTSSLDSTAPVVVWNCTQTCNLNCTHCYADSENRQYSGELSTEEALAMITDLAHFNVPVLLLSGGEPLLRSDLFQLIAQAHSLNIKCTLSTNGTLITPPMANRIKKAGVSYVGISLDGIGNAHDIFRGTVGSFNAALQGIRNCMAVGQKVGLRFTLSQQTLSQLEAVFQLIEEERIPRVCFYHLVHSGRGSQMPSGTLTASQTRQALDFIIKKALELGPKTEILTVDNHADSIYTYLYALDYLPHKAPRILELMRQNKGNRSGITFGCIGPTGDIYPDQFTRTHALGNIRQSPFSHVWSNTQHPLLHQLRNRKPLLQGRCSICKWLNYCNGNFRARAEAHSGYFWASDPGCYLTDSEITTAED